MFLFCTVGFKWEILSFFKWKTFTYKNQILKKPLQILSWLLIINWPKYVFSQALVKRSPQSQTENVPNPASSSVNTGNMGMELTSSLRRRPSSPTIPDKGGEPRSLPRDKHRITTLAKQLGQIICSFYNFISFSCWFKS